MSGLSAVAAADETAPAAPAGAVEYAAGVGEDRIEVVAVVVGATAGAAPVVKLLEDTVASDADGAEVVVVAVEIALAAD